MAEKKKPVKKRSDEGRSVRKEDRKIVGKATRRELKKDAKRVVAGASMAVGLTAAGRGIKAAKAVSSVKRLNPSKKTFGQINKEVSKASKNTKAATNKVEKRALKAANSPSKNKAASDSGRKYMGEKYMTTSFPSPGRFSVKPDVKKLKEATTPRTPKGTARLNPKFVRDLRKGR